MKRPELSSSNVFRTLRVRERHTACAAYNGASYPGYTLIEIMVATTLALILLVAVITIFANVSESVSASRSMLESAEQLRLAAARLQQDLSGVTVTMSPPRDPANNEGYFEYIEGPVTANNSPAVNTDISGNPADSTAGDFDDILMFTTRSTGRPFVGKCNGNAIQSDVAEVAWFIRGRTLHRRVLLVAPGAFAPVTTANYYTNYDISAHLNGAGLLVPNTLGDLTRRECRFAHNSGAFPYLFNFGWTVNGQPFQFPTLPTLNECSVSGWFPVGPPPLLVNSGLDLWTNAQGHRILDNALNSGTDGTRVADDVILNNVIGFDVKAWDSGAPIVFDSSNNRTLLPGDAGYVLPGDAGWTAACSIIGYGAYGDLGYHAGYAGNPQPKFHTYGVNNNSGLQGTATTARVYDTYSTTYEGDQAHDGLDNNTVVQPGYGIVDDDSEKLHTPPYPYPLRGIQVKIRVFEPDSRQIREVTVVQDFLPQ